VNFNFLNSPIPDSCQEIHELQMGVSAPGAARSAGRGSPRVYRRSQFNIQTTSATKLAIRMATLPNEMNPIIMSKIKWPIEPAARQSAGTMN
jgi:hypothetical protein